MFSNYTVYYKNAACELPLYLISDGKFEERMLNGPS